MIFCNEHETITLTNQNLHELNIENTVCYVFVGGNPGGTEGDVYVFVIKDNEMKIYDGNIYYGDLSKDKINEIYSGALDWVRIPYVQGHFVHIREKMAEDLQNNWKILNENNHFKRLIKGVLLTARKYEIEFINLDSHINLYGDDDKNVLCKVFDLYPNIWREPRRFKAIMMDFLPMDKLKRNLLCICIEENIPEDLFTRKVVNNFEISKYKKKLINACGCSDLLAGEVLSLWMHAFGVTTDDTSHNLIYDTSLEDLGLSVRSYNCLKRAGKKTLGDLAKMTVEDFMQVRNLGRKSTEEVLGMLKKYGIIPADKKDVSNDAELQAKRIKIDDLYKEGMISVHTRTCLMRVNVLTLGDVTQKSLDELLKIRSLGRKPLDNILKILEYYGLSLREDGIKENIQNDDSWENKSLDELGLSVRSYNCLKREGINTVKELIDLEGDSFVRIRNLGIKSAEEVIEKLQVNGVPKHKIEHLINALDNTRIERQREIEEREKRKKIKELEDEVDDLGNRLQQLQIQVQLKLAAKKLEEGDFSGSVVALEKAVELGYKGNYSHLGIAYLTGLNGVQADPSKGFKILSQFYDEFNEGKLDIDDKGCMVQVCYNLATCYLWELQGGNNPESLKQYKLNNVLDLYKEAVDYAPEEKDEENSSTSAEMLMVIGCCFYYGEIHSEGHEIVTIPKDYEYAFKAFMEAERLGNVQAISLLAEMYEEGKYVEKDIVTAERKYLRAALKSEKNAIEWCQKHYIDKLPWNKYQNWKSILLSDVLPERYAESAKEQGDLITLEDIHQLDFNNLKGRVTFKLIRLPLILDLVGKYVIEYNPALDKERRTVFETVIGQVAPRTNGINICNNTSIDVLDLSVREYNTLKRAGINTIGDLKKLNSEDMMGGYDHIRRTLLDRIIEKLKKNSELIENLKVLGIYLDDTNDSFAEHNHPGRDKCDKLREIRKKIAEANGISFEPAECHHTGPCLGTCPVCDEEIKYIDNELQKKKIRGEEIILNGIALEDIKESGCNIESSHNEDIVEMGMELPYDNGNNHNEIIDDSDYGLAMGMANPDDFSNGDVL